MPRTTTRDARRGWACLLLDRLADAAPTEAGARARLVELDDPARRDYLLGLLDTLAFLGLVRLTDDGLGAFVVSPQAGWAIRLLGDLLDTGEPLVADWRSAGLSLPGERRHLFERGTDVLAALEARRHDLLPRAAPVRAVEAAVGLIARPEGPGELHFLLTYDADARAWQLPGGRRELADPSLESTLLRELDEELGLAGLRVPEDVTLRPLPPLADTRESPSYGVRTRATLHPFLVKLARDPAPRPDARWLSAGEVRARRTADGQLVDAGLLVALLDRPGLNLPAMLTL